MSGVAVTERPRRNRTAALNSRAPTPQTTPTTSAPPISAHPNEPTRSTGRIGVVPSTAAKAT